jgi:hypothetical protein
MHVPLGLVKGSQVRPLVRAPGQGLGHDFAPYAEVSQEKLDPDDLCSTGQVEGIGLNRGISAAPSVSGSVWSLEHVGDDVAVLVGTAGLKYR